MIDLEDCTILGNETIDANSLNRCMFNLHRKMSEAAERSVGATSDNIPDSPFFSGGFDDALTEIPYISGLGLQPADEDTAGLVPRLYCGDLDIYGSQDNQTFATESETGVYYYTSEQISTFAPSVSSLFSPTAPMILRPLLLDDGDTMVTGVSSLGNSSSPTIKFTSYLICSNSGVSFGTITLKRMNGDRQKNVFSLNVARDLIGIDGVESVDFLTIGNGFSSGVRTVSDTLDMISDIGQCTITYDSDVDIILSNITKSDNSESICIEKDSGRIVDSVDGSYDRYVELPNDEVVLNFFVMFTLKENAVKYSDDLWCFYIVSDFNYGRRVLNNANSWARDYFKYSFRNFLAADDGRVSPDGTKEVDQIGCVVEANDAFNGCYNATFESLCWISPALKYAERMFKGCTHATFDSLPHEIAFDDMRSCVSMFENCMSAPFSNITRIDLSGASRMGMMFAGCTNASFDSLTSLYVGGDASRMFYGDTNGEFGALERIGGSGSRLVSMFEGCDNARFDAISSVSSAISDSIIEADRMFYGLRKPMFSQLSSIDLGNTTDNSKGYDGVSMFEGCLNATFENLTSLGHIVDGSSMFHGCDPYFSADDVAKNMNHATFGGLKTLGGENSSTLLYGNEMFSDNYYLSMNITGGVAKLRDGTNMFKNTSSIVVDAELADLIEGRGMFSYTDKAVVNNRMPDLEDGKEMFRNCEKAIVSVGNGGMDSLIDADSMFLAATSVELNYFPGSVRDARSSFAYIYGDCRIYGWDSAEHERFCDNCFYNSSNVAITGNVVGGSVRSTSHMFDSVDGLLLCNTEMVDAGDVEHRWYYTEAGEKYAYIQGFDDNGHIGNFTFVGCNGFDDVGGFITDTMTGSVQDSMMIIANFGARSVSYDFYVLSPSSMAEYSTTESGSAQVELLVEDLKFNPSTIIASGDYSYASVSGYSTSEIADRGELVIMRDDRIDSDVVSSIYTLRANVGSSDDLREFVIEKINSEHIIYNEYLNGSINSTMAGDAEVSHTGQMDIIIHNGTATPITYSYSENDEFIGFDFDFIQVSSANDIIEPQLCIIARVKKDGVVEENAVIPLPAGEHGSGTSAPSFIRLGESDYKSKLMVLNSADDIHVDIIDVRRYQDTANTYGWLMQYRNKPAAINDNRLIFCKNDGSPNALDDMMRNPKHLLGDMCVAQVFTDHSFSNDVPMSFDSAAASSNTSRVRTRFSVGNADMLGVWKTADYMFHNVVEDSLLSGYYCFTDTSMEDVRYMFALDEDRRVENDTTFDNAGPLMQKLERSNVTRMDGMFLNRNVSNPLIFEDLYADTEHYVSFQIPNGATAAPSAFMNCSIATTASVLVEGEGGEESVVDISIDEIGLHIPPTLSSAMDMFNGYDGPSIRFGYGNDGTVYLSDGLESGCRGMFEGCSFVDDGSTPPFAFSVPSIYMDMFKGSDFKMDSISSLEVRNGMNFASPYDIHGPFFYNDCKILGCSEISFDSLRTDVIDWFCTDIGDVEGVYLATVIGPVNSIEYKTDGTYLSGDYRLMSASADAHGDWTTYMSPISNFTDEMIENLYESTNSLKLNLMTEVENKRARMSCMFNLPILFSETDAGRDDGRLGNKLGDTTAPDDYLYTYERLSDERYIAKTYNQMNFGLVKRINAVEMPFAFAGLSSATFNSLTSISPSAFMAYGAFMNCSSATFDNLKTVEFMQDGVNQPDSFSSRFADAEDREWYGNYCNMFAGCSSATFDKLETLALNSIYGTYGADNGNSMLAWVDVNGDVCYFSHSNLDSRFAFTFYVSDYNTIHLSMSNKKRKFFDYDTGCYAYAMSSMEVRFFTNPSMETLDIMAAMTLNPAERDGEESADPFHFYTDSLGYASTDRDAFAGYTVPVTGNVPGQDTVGRLYTIGEDADLSTPKYVVLYMNATGYHTMDVDESFATDINYRISISEVDDHYMVGVYDNSPDGGQIVGRYVTDVIASDDCSFSLEMSELNYELTPFVTIRDSRGIDNIYEVLPDGSVERLSENPKNGLLEKISSSPEGYIHDFQNPETHEWFKGEYGDSYGQSFSVSTGMEEQGGTAGDYDYVLLLRSSDTGETVAKLHTDVISHSNNPSPEDVQFSIGSYMSNGMPCIVVSIFEKNGTRHTYYKIYKERIEGDNMYRYVEETIYDPRQEMEYKSIGSLPLNPDASVRGIATPLGHKAYCSGMFMDDKSATFEKLRVVNLPSVGKCAGMFTDCTSADFSSLIHLVLPSNTGAGTSDYAGVFSGLNVNDVDFSGLSTERTNIYALGEGGGKTIGYEFFSGMLDVDGVAYDSKFRPMPRDVAVDIMKLPADIADRMKWVEWLDFDIKVGAGETFKFAVRQWSGENETVVNWGDGNVERFYDLSTDAFTQLSHTYNDGGTYTIVVSDTISRVIMADYGSSPENYSDDNLLAKCDSVSNTSVVKVNHFGGIMEDMSFAFNGCTRLTDTCPWTETVQNVSYCYNGCSNLTTPLQKWGDEITICTRCYHGCSSMNSTFSDDIYELMPLTMDDGKYIDCVLGAGSELRKKFFVDWGGTAQSIDANTLMVKVS